MPDAGPRPDGPLFVVQHHLATADHYDVRLEIGGVLVSWAVPRGPSTDPAVRRLALRTPDHALAHADVEGVMGPRRQGGTVQVWDRGTYLNTSHRGAEPIDAATALDEGHLSVQLDGHKLEGGWTFHRTGTGTQWLLIKRRDDAAQPDEITRTRPESVLTGRTMAEIERS